MHFLINLQHESGLKCMDRRDIPIRILDESEGGICEGGVEGNEEEQLEQ